MMNNYKNMSAKEIVKRLKDSLDYEFDLSFNERKELLSYIEQLEKQAELGSHYKHLYSKVKKQKDDVVEYIKEHLTDNGRFLMLNEWQVPDLLRMLGEIDDNKRNDE